MERLFLEAIVVGIIITIIHLIITSFQFILIKDTYYNGALIMFLIGFLTHFISEISGVNKWYCKNGAACL